MYFCWCRLARKIKKHIKTFGKKFKVFRKNIKEYFTYEKEDSRYGLVYLIHIYHVVKINSN